MEYTEMFWRSTIIDKIVIRIAFTPVWIPPSITVFPKVLLPWMNPQARKMFPKKERGRKYILNRMLSFKVGWKKYADKIGNKEKTAAPMIIAPRTKSFKRTPLLMEVLYPK